eukprot:2753299-Rhodomonas_salina.1
MAYGVASAAWHGSSTTWADEPIRYAATGHWAIAWAASPGPYAMPGALGSAGGVRYGDRECGVGHTRAEAGREGGTAAENRRGP